VTSPNTEFLVVITIAMTFAGLLSVLIFAFLVRESKRKQYDEDRHRVELEVIRKSLEDQLYRLNERLVATDARWRDVNHLLISAQKFAPSPDQAPPVPRSNFLENAGLRETDVDKKLVFVLTPFHSDYWPTYEAVASVCQSIGLKCLRGDEEHVTGDILQHILRLMSQARLIIANLDGRNPNVFYELGIAHALGKPVLPIASSPEDLPFDIRSTRILFWKTPQELGQKLRDELLKIFVATN
jgi:hypothetical protein